MQKTISSGWTASVTSVEGITVRRGVTNDEINALLPSSYGADENPIEVSFEYVKETNCNSIDGCTDDEQTNALIDGENARSNLITSITTGAFTQRINDDAELVGLTVMKNVTISQVTAASPQIEVLAITTYPSIQITPAPTPAPTFSNCNDSKLRFNVWKDGVLLRKTCAWVANHPNEKCRLEGVKSHCPRTCWSCETCVDSSVRFRFEFNGSDSYRSCNWVKRKNVAKRCNIDGIPDTCRATCAVCA